MIKFTVLASAALLAEALLSLGATAPPNDHLNSAIALTGTNLATSGTNIDATREVGEPNHAANSGGKSVWWKWTAPAAGSVLIQTAGSSFDTLLAAYTGASFANLDAVVANDDNGSLKTSAIAFNVIASVTYRVVVDGFSGATGEIHLNLVFREKILERPPNDHFADRIVLSGSVTEAVGANYFATKESDESNHANELGGTSVWWAWTAPLTGDVTMNTAGSTIDTLLAVYSGSVLTNLSVVAKNDDADNDQPTSRVTFNATGGATYQIAVDGFRGAVGDIHLRIGMDDLVWLGLPQSLPGRAYRLKLSGPLGKQYTLEASADLVKWLPLAILPGADGIFEFTDLDAASARQRFYRARQMP